MKIVELKSPADFAKTYPLIRQLNPEMTKQAFTQHLKVMVKNGYRAIAAVEGKKILGTSGFWTGARFWCGKYIEPDNVVVDQNQRSRGIGKLLMQWIESEARRQKCDIVMMDAYTHNTESHRFYYREGYIIKGFCFVKNMRGK
jgi:GNAT superfamily N-acetyltransferase